MVRTIFSVALLVLGMQVAQLSAECVNNTTGNHVRKTRSKTGRKLVCRIQPITSYKNKKLAARFYKKGQTCRFCGCPSSSHSAAKSSSVITSVSKAPSAPKK